MTSSRRINIMVSAGEASGDAHAAHALEALQTRGTDFESFGMGASLLQTQGCDLIVDCRELAVIGFIDVVKNYPRFMIRLRKLKAAMKARRPDLLLIVDYPNFNLKLAEYARQLNIPVLFYISPKVWASRPGRVPKIGARISHMAVIFPFEVDIYEKAGIPVSYVGNPVVEDAQSSLTRDEACTALDLDPSRPVILLMPGSRKGELERHMSLLVASTEKLANERPTCQFILPLANTIDREWFNQLLDTAGANLPSASPLQIVDGQSITAMRAADVALVASGTATLETGLMGTPMVVLYKVSPLNYAIIKRMINIDDVSLVNIVAQRRIVPELIQDDATADNIAAEALLLLNDETRRSQMLHDLAELKLAMGEPGASERVAALIESLVISTKV